MEILQSKLELEKQIEYIKTTFQKALESRLNLSKVSAPIIVQGSTGINDDLNGVEKPVSFSMHKEECTIEVVQSLAKWKRLRLAELNLAEGEGIITDMKAIRPDEVLSNIHSLIVEQWDWEKRIAYRQRNVETLQQHVRGIYDALKLTEVKLYERDRLLKPQLPETIKFIHAEELLQMFPELAPKQREDEITKKYGAVFIIGIGGELSNGEPHDGRAPDYDDWSSVQPNGLAGMNGDIIVWNPVLQSAFELSSMGIRVDKIALNRQLEIKQDLFKQKLPFHKKLMNDKLPQSIGGGIGQSRLCMLLLGKRHIGEVQPGVWPESVVNSSLLEGIEFL